MAHLSTSWLQRSLPLFGRRLVVVDPGSRFVKVLVLDAVAGRVRVLHFQTLEQHRDGTAVTDEADAALAALFAEAGAHERVLVLPQYRAIAQTIDVAPGKPVEIDAAIAREARRLSGLDDAAMSFGAVRLKPFGRFQSPYWLTLCKREEIDALLDRFARSPEPNADYAAAPLVAEVTTSAQAMFAAAIAALRPAGGHAVLVDVRSENTVVAIVAHGQGVHATTVPLGLRQFIEALSRASGCSAADAERLLVQRNLFEGQASLAAYHASLEQWYAEIRLSVSEWLEDHSELGLSLASLPVYLCGSCAGQPGLVDELNRRGPLKFEQWEEIVTAGARWPMADYLVAYGAALVALGKGGRGVSLLPPKPRQVQRQKRRVETLQTVNTLLLVATAVLLVAGIWQKWRLIGRKEQLTLQTQSALESTKAIERLHRRVNLDYERIHPVLQRQRKSLETLQALAAVRELRTNDDFWVVLFADEPSYQAGTTVPEPAAATNRPAFAGVTNPPPARREFVLEICVPKDGEPLRRVLSEVVAALKRSGLFGRVDSLPPERKRDLVDPNVALSNRVYAIAMEMRGHELPDPVVPAERPRTPPVRDSRRGALPPPERNAESPL